MTKAEKLAMLRVMIEGEDSDTTLSTFLNIAGRKIIEKYDPYNADDIEEVPVRWHILQCEIAAYLLNKRGAEGQTNHTENGITRNWGAADIPPAMLSVITTKVGVIK